MDKVIIDGVDVSGCEFIDGNYCKLCDMKSALDELIVHRQYCDRTVNKDCYYKQLKRLQAENERLKEELRTEKIYSSQIEELEGSLQHAKAENEELSESIKRLKNMAKAAALGREKYSRALQEIRDVILSPEVIDEETKKLHTSEELDNIVRWHREDKLIKIKAKINEVIGEE